MNITGRRAFWAAIGALLLSGGAVSGCVVARAPTARLATGQEQSFGFFDPHLHLAVVGVETAERWPAGGAALEARGRFYSVTVRARSDAAEIDVDPSRLELHAVVESGRRIAPLEAAGRVARFERPLRPGDRDTRTFLFDVPLDEQRPVLEIRHARPLARWVPDHANGFLTRRVVFSLDPPARPSP